MYIVRLQLLVLGLFPYPVLRNVKRNLVEMLLVLQLLGMDPLYPTILINLFYSYGGKIGILVRDWIFIG